MSPDPSAAPSTEVERTAETLEAPAPPELIAYRLRPWAPVKPRTLLWARFFLGPLWRR